VTCFNNRFLYAFCRYDTDIGCYIETIDLLEIETGWKLISRGIKNDNSIDVYFSFCNQISCNEVLIFSEAISTNISRKCEKYDTIHDEFFEFRPPKEIELRDIGSIIRCKRFIYILYQDLIRRIL